MTKREAAIVTAFTGVLIGEFSEFHKYAEEIMGRPIFTHEFADEEIEKKLKELSKPDILKMLENAK